MASLSLDEEARLYTTNAERERYGLLATLFGIIVSLDYLERAYVRDSVPAAEWVTIIFSRFSGTFFCSLGLLWVFCFGRLFELISCLSWLFFSLKRYSPACTRLLSQYKTMLKLVGDDVPSIEAFMTRYYVWFNFSSLCLSFICRGFTFFLSSFIDGPPCSVA